MEQLDFQLPQFPGGEAAFRAFVYTNRRFLEDATGQVVVSFMIEKDGLLTDIKVLRGLNKEADEEAIRILKTSPKWIPGSQNGIFTRTAYTMPINFGS